MTIATPPITSATEDIVTTSTTAETSEAASSEIQISLPTTQQQAILRSICDNAYSIIQEIGSTLPKPLENNSMLKLPLSPQRAKRSASMPLLSNSPQASKSGLTKAHSMETFTPRAQAQASQSSSSTTRASISWYPSPLAKQTCDKHLFLSLPQLSPHETIAQSSPVRFKRLSMPIFKPSTIRHLNSETRTRSNSVFVDSPLFAQEQETIVSPLSLFSHLQQQTSNTLLQSKQTYKGSHQDKQQQQQEQQQQQQQQELEEIFEASFKQTLPAKMSQSLPKEMIEFSLSESHLSSLFHMRVSHYDVLRMCAEIMKLMLRSRSLEQHEKSQTRRLFIEEAQKLERSYARQADISRWLGISTAVLGIVGAASPICGEIAGDQIINFVQKNMNVWQKATSAPLFKNIGQVFSSLSHLSETASKIYELQESSHRATAESYKDLMRLEHDEVIRMIEETKDHWKNMENLLLQILQTHHDSIRSLYN